MVLRVLIIEADHSIGQIIFALLRKCNHTASLFKFPPVGFDHHITEVPNIGTNETPLEKFGEQDCLITPFHFAILSCKSEYWTSYQALDPRLSNPMVIGSNGLGQGSYVSPTLPTDQIMGTSQNLAHFDLIGMEMLATSFDLNPMVSSVVLLPRTVASDISPMESYLIEGNKDFATSVVGRFILITNARITN
ncbi:hypothetical protein VNO78_12310 [Psophocarpus tetragonolobus]|uniref:Uncharacterized protein n=1 Tax=Psophocarpus tetragonolobus TaxID=3891 RepID=A0AAN9SQQ9_PSOTE